MTGDLVTVFGGTGFLGRTIAHRLAEDGVAVRVCARTPGAADEHFSGGRVETRATDITDESSVHAAVRGAAGVVNAVGLYVEHGGASFQAVHVEGAARLARAAARAGVRSLIHISGIGVDPGSDSPYVRARAIGEAEVQRAFPDATILRPSVLFGPDDAFLSSLRAMTKWLPVIPLFGDGSVRLQPVHVADVAAAAASALRREDARGRVFELGGASVYSYREILKLILRHDGRRRVLLPVPYPVWRLLARTASVLAAAPLTIDQVVLMQSDNVVGDSVATIDDLGLRPRAFGIESP